MQSFSEIKVLWTPHHIWRRIGRTWTSSKNRKLVSKKAPILTYLQYVWLRRTLRREGATWIWRSSPHLPSLLSSQHSLSHNSSGTAHVRMRSILVLCKTDYLLVGLQCQLSPVSDWFIHSYAEVRYVLWQVLGQLVRSHVGAPVHEVLLGGQHSKVVRFLAPGHTWNHVSHFHVQAPFQERFPQK